MNFNLTYLILLISFVHYGQSNLERTDIYQTGFDYYNLRVNILKEIKYQDVKIKEIKQTTLYTNYNNELRKIDSAYYLEYVLKFDTLNNLKNVLYDFNTEYTSSKKSKTENKNEPKTVNRTESNPIERLYKFISINDTIFYNYYENIYEYDEYGSALNSIKIIRPIRDGNVDGTYIQELKEENIRYKNYYNNDLLIKKEMYVNDTLYWTTEYYYKTINSRYKKLNLIEKIIEKSENQSKIKYEICLEYNFYKE